MSKIKKDQPSEINVFQKPRRMVLNTTFTGNHEKMSLSLTDLKVLDILFSRIDPENPDATFYISFNDIWKVLYSTSGGDKINIISSSINRLASTLTVIPSLNTETGDYEITVGVYLAGYTVKGNINRPKTAGILVAPNGLTMRKIFADKELYLSNSDFTGSMKTKGGYFLRSFLDANGVFGIPLKFSLEDLAAKMDLLKEFHSKRFQDFRRDHLEKAVWDITKNSTDMTAEVICYEKTGRKYTHVTLIAYKIVADRDFEESDTVAARFSEQIRYQELCAAYEQSKPVRQFLDSLVSGYLTLKEQPEMISMKFGSPDRICELLEKLSYEQAIAAMDLILTGTALSLCDPQWQFNCIVEVIMENKGGKAKKTTALAPAKPASVLDSSLVNADLLKILLGSTPMCEQALEDLQNALSYLKATTLPYLHVAGDDRPTDLIREFIFEKLSTDNCLAVLRRYIARYDTIQKKDSPKSRQLYLLSCLYNELENGTKTEDQDCEEE